MKPIVAGVSIVLAATAALAMQVPSDDVLARVDHLVYATPDLELGIQAIEKLTGVRASAGGQHPGLGTRNALIALGSSTYLEIIGPDPEQPKPDGPRRFGIDELKAPRLLTWVAKGTGLAPFVDRARASGVRLGDVIAGSRKRPDGVVLSWRYTDPNVILEERLVPYFIDWGTSPHPATTAAPGLSLRALRAEHPEPERMARILKQLGLNLPVRRGARPSLIATLDSPKGRIELRSN
ncbi:MAG TPA: VOC family protein [Vicinamibacterales bacterium]|nr:VOC family protein [Vicinamibacterales bacterium]